MKVYIDCNSLLIQKALEYYLDIYIVNEDEADFIITDHKRDSKKPIFMITKSDKGNLKNPFTKKMLFDALESFRYEYKQDSNDQNELDFILKSLKKRKDKKLDKIISEYDSEK